MQRNLFQTRGRFWRYKKTNNNNNNNKDVYSSFRIVQYMYIIYLLYCSNVFFYFLFLFLTFASKA